jgi:hypothetical protein
MNREMLEFQDAVKEYFAFLNDKYGFKCISSTLYLVKYISDKVFIDIYHERISFEIYFVVGLLKDNKVRLTSNDIELLYSPEHATKCYQGSNKKNVYFSVEHIANVAEQYSKDALIDSEKFFKDTLAMESKEQQCNLLLQEIRIADEKAKKAWEVKDYKTVIEIYNQYAGQLNAIQKKMLDYSKRKVEGD